MSVESTALLQLRNAPRGHWDECPSFRLLPNSTMPSPCMKSIISTPGSFISRLRNRRDRGKTANRELTCPAWKEIVCVGQQKASMMGPKEERLIGIYDSQVAFGQSHVLLVWKCLIMRNGRSIVLE